MSTGTASRARPAPVIADPARRPDPTRVLIAHDQALFRTGLVRLLAEEPDLDVVDEADVGAEAVRLTAEHMPDIILMDYKLLQADFDVMRRILEQHPRVRVMVVSAPTADGLIVKALTAGAAAYLLYDSGIASLLSTIRAVMSSGCVVSSRVVDYLLAMLTGEAGGRGAIDGLTERELEIVKMTAAGLGTKQVAYRLHISEKTVRNHVTHIYEKLAVHDRHEVLVFAVRQGLLDVSEHKRLRLLPPRQ